MGQAKRERQRAGRQARLAAEAAARRKAAARKRAIGFAVLLGVVGLALFLVTRGGDDDGTDVASGSTTSVPSTDTTVSGTSSAAGAPCVPVSDPLPAGAPQVPVEVGSPPTQLVIRDLVEGTGQVVPAGATVRANYIGVACSTGIIFDSSYSRGEPTPFPLTGVIQGWRDGIPGMKVGGQRLLGIPAGQAYAAAGRPPDIRPDEALWFVVEVVSIS